METKNTLKQELIHPLFNSKNGIFGDGLKNIYLSLGLDATRDFTISVLANRSSNSTDFNRHFISNYAHRNTNGPGLSFYNPSNTIYLHDSTGININSNAINLYKFGLHHYIITKTDTEFKCFRDGVLVGSYDLTLTQDKFTSKKLNILTTATDSKLNGSLYDIKLFNYALSDLEVKSFYNYGKPFEYFNYDKTDGLIKTSSNRWENINSTNPTLTFSNLKTNNKLIKIKTKIKLKSNEPLLLINVRNVSSNTEFQQKEYTHTVNKILTPNEWFFIDAEFFINGYDKAKRIACSFEKASGINCIIEGEVLEYFELGCISEYLPQNINKTKWLDTSGNNNHAIIYFANNQGNIDIKTNRTLYFQDVLINTVPPNIIPDFVGQKYVHLDTNIYIAIGTTSKNDWKLI